MELFELFFNSEMTDFWVNVLLPILSIIIPVFATVYTVNNTINARNKENHQPYLVLEKVLDVDDINKFSYYLTPVGRNYLEAHPEIDYSNIECENDINIKNNNIMMNSEEFNGMPVKEAKEKIESGDVAPLVYLELEETKEKLADIMVRIISDQLA